MNPHFGEPWGSWREPDSERVPTPVGEPCIYCGEDIVDGDQGILMSHAYLDDNDKPAHKIAPQHRECLLAGVVGHGLGQCACHPETGTLREQALAVDAWVRKHGRTTDT